MLNKTHSYLINSYKYKKVRRWDIIHYFKVKQYYTIQVSFFFNINLCVFLDIPEEICHFSFKRNLNGSESKRNLLCKEYTINQYKYHQANVYVFKNQTPQETVVDPNEKTLNGKIKEYTCLILNSDNCVTSNNTFQLKVQCE